jgi:AcrR family transcriptional regulator
MQTQDGSLDIDSLDGAGSPTRLRRREQAQRERQDRVRATARKLLAEQGYDATTLRQVAEHSGMAPSTLFRYVTDKRDLIYLAFSRELKGVTESSLVAPKPWQTFNEKILSMVQPRYRLFGEEPTLSRILLSETLQPAFGIHFADFTQIRDRFIQGMQAVVADAQQTGEVGSTESSESISRLIFFSYSGAVRWWLTASQNPEWRSGVRDFATILRLQTTGLHLRSEIPDASSTEVRPHRPRSRSLGRQLLPRPGDPLQAARPR